MENQPQAPAPPRSKTRPSKLLLPAYSRPWVYQNLPISIKTHDKQQMPVWPEGNDRSPSLRLPLLLHTKFGLEHLLADTSICTRKWHLQHAAKTN